MPPEQDGVPYMSSLPIGPGETFVYEFPLRHAGTYWYHSHTDLQEQRGVHGGIVVAPRVERVDYDREAVLVLQDWTHEKPRQVLANLKKDGHYYALRKGSVVSIAGFLERNALPVWWQNRWRRMEGMDVADVAYDAFLVNGKPELALFQDALPGERIRLRLINAGASSYFLLHSSALELEVVSADGLDVRPVVVDEILVGMAETYDVIVTVPDKGAAELRATAQDGSGFASLFVGDGERTFARDMTPPDLYASHGEHDAGHPAMHAHQHHGPRRLTYADLDSLDGARYRGEGEGEAREVVLRLTGNMETYNWSFDDVPLSRADKILVSKGETVRFTFINETMMHHPLHLHGHFFRVFTGADAGPFKHTVDVPPMATISIEFLANEEKDWFFHCHNLYHAKTGMARVIRYDDYAGSPAFERAKMRSPDIMDSDFYYAGEIELLSDFGSTNLRVSNTRHRYEMGIESRDWQEERFEANYLYRHDRWTQWLVGLEKESGEDGYLRAGVRYVLPLLIETELFVTSDGDIEAELETHLQLTTRGQLRAEYETTGRYHAALEYRFNEALSLVVAHTSDVDGSLGIRWRF